MSNTKTMQHLEDDMSLMFEELDSLSTINVFGYPKWLQDNYELTRVEATYVFNQWMEINFPKQSIPEIVSKIQRLKGGN